MRERKKTADNEHIFFGKKVKIALQELEFFSGHTNALILWFEIEHAWSEKDL
jgi:hypothetical protein